MRKLGFPKVLTQIFYRVLANLHIALVQQASQPPLLEQRCNGTNAELGYLEQGGRAQHDFSLAWLEAACVGNFSPAMGARNQVGIGFSYRPASLCSLAIQFQTRFLESIPRPIAGLKFLTLIFQWKWTRHDLKLAVRRREF